MQRNAGLALALMAIIVLVGFGLGACGCAGAATAAQADCVALYAGADSADDLAAADRACLDGGAP